MNTDPRRMRKIRYALLAGSTGQFALLYAPQPVLPQVAESFSLGAGTVALLISAATLGLAAAALPMGALAQALGRRRTMVTALVASEALGLLLPLIRSFPLLVGARLLQGVAVAGLAAVVAAYLADETRGHRMGATMGLYVAGTTLGGMSGRVIGGVVGDFAGWHGGLLAVAVVAGACTVLFVLLLPPERSRMSASFGEAPEAPSNSKPGWDGLRPALRDPVLRALYLMAALGMGSFVTVYNVLSFRLTGPPLSIPPALAALAFLAYASGTVSSAFAGRIADRWGRLGTLLAGLAITLCGLGLMLADAVAPILLGLVLFTGGFFAAHAVASGWVGVRASARARGQAAALYQFCYYGGSSLGGLLGGWAYAMWNWPGMSALLAAWIVLAAIAVSWAGRGPWRGRPPQVASES
ncbi:MFS transporter [Parasphingorhabdus pacifica]